MKITEDREGRTRDTAQSWPCQGSFPFLGQLQSQPGNPGTAPLPAPPEDQCWGFPDPIMPPAHAPAMMADTKRPLGNATEPSLVSKPPSQEAQISQLYQDLLEAVPAPHIQELSLAIKTSIFSSTVTTIKEFLYVLARKEWQKLPLPPST